ncbi:zinc-binding dehydrogenase [Streptomyces sp. NPDC005492]|uniref:zinc-binding dehydrogenase n=1 Tax=Streptomyces sp. NPDC005492 TaxID=3156883 RepID=UPI0033BD7E13
MHAIRLHTFGPAENLIYESVDDPPPGREVAGVVESLGEGVAGLWLGKRVVAHLGFAPGGYAELAAVDIDGVHEIPENLDFAQAVAMIGTGRTAMGIVQFSELTADSVVVVLAAAGGLGTLLVQYAAHAGATVIALADGPEKVATTRTNGADLAVDYTDPEWPGKVRAWLGDRPATVVYTVDGLSEQVLGPVMMRKTGTPNPVRTLESRALTEAADGRLVPTVHRFPLAAAAEAHRALETRGTTGKVVLEP